mmetsp:Transcript_13228/g.37577  ORF Transcript_13228/g.37577 Transcript_13228/m.37577 type:complete len:439 (-) Transcript_13228:93-1409(-)
MKRVREENENEREGGLATDPEREGGKQVKDELAGTGDDADEEKRSSLLGLLRSIGENFNDDDDDDGTGNDDHYPSDDIFAGTGGEGGDRIGWQQLNLYKFLVYGAFVSAFCEVMVYPFDLIKTRLQTQGTVYARFTEYQGLRDAVRTIWKKEGLRGYFRGVHVTAMMTLPCDIMYFGSYEYSRHSFRVGYQWVHDRWPALPGLAAVAPVLNFTAGGVAEVASSVFWIPSDIVSQKLMIQGDLSSRANTTGSNPHSALRVIRQTLQQDGTRGMYRGYLPTLSNFAIHSAISFMSYEHVRSFMYRHYPRSGFWKTLRRSVGEGTWDAGVSEGARTPTQKCLLHILSGTVAGATAGFLTTPIDVVKTRLQIQNFHGRQQSTNTVGVHVHSGFREMASAIYREEGWRGFTRGCVPRVLHSSPYMAITFFTYEIVKQLCLKEQ